MRVTVFKNWIETDYIFAPEHKAEVIGWYTKEYWAGRIQCFKVTMDNGEIVAVGALGDVKVVA
jgi:hypothetical protein